MKRFVLYLIILIGLFEIIEQVEAGRLFGGGGSNFFEIDPVTGAFTFIGGDGRFPIDVLAFDSSGRLFGGSGANFFEIDPVTGAFMFIGGDGRFPIDALAFDSSGRLFGGGGANFFEIDPVTGAFTFIGGDGRFTIDALAFEPSEVNIIPEPSTLLLFVVGIIGTALYGWQRRMQNSPQKRRD